MLCPWENRSQIGDNACLSPLIEFPGENGLLISVIFTTYNSPDWLAKVLWGFHYQADIEFEIVIADDGSRSDTEQVIKAFSAQTHLTVKHVWHADEGFQKCRILNEAILAAEGEYLILTDGDCIPRHDFVTAHRQEAEPGRYLSGGYFKLPLAVSQAIDQNAIEAGLCFDRQWLLHQGMKSSLKFMKLTASGGQSKWFNRLTPTKRTWNGHNASGWKADALAVNGFDERLQYGGLDCEFGERLVNLGVRPKQIRYSAITVHLDHPRGYASAEGWARNRAIRRTVADQKVIETPAGIRQLSL